MEKQIEQRGMHFYVTEYYYAFNGRLGWYSKDKSRLFNHSEALEASRGIIEKWGRRNLTNSPANKQIVETARKILSDAEDTGVPTS